MGSSHMDWVPPESFDEYRLVKALGRGSMGQVWLAHDTVLDRLVAVKFIAEIPAHDAVRQRFLTEARAAARVQHQNIIAVYRVGEIGPRPYLISEYVRGDSLDKIARPIAWLQLLEISIGLARGLAAAHRQGVLHRDLKPANAIVSETGEVKLLDFGLAKLLPHVATPHADAPSSQEAAATLSGVPSDPMVAAQGNGEPFEPLLDQRAKTIDVPTGALARVSGGSITLPEATPPGFPRTWESREPLPAIDLLPSVTRADAVLGTPAYMPPEAWRSEPATPRSDVYSLGALLYSLGAGAPPHRGDSPEDLRSSALASDAPPLASAAPGIDPGFAAVVDRCLRRDPNERFASGDAVREALEALVAGGKTAARVPARPSQKPLSRRPRRMVLIGAALALAVFSYIMFGGSHREVNSCAEGMMPVAAGTYVMGSPEGEGDSDEQPQHEVTLSAYCIDKTEVTVAAYAKCVAAKGCSAAPLTTNWSNDTAESRKTSSQRCNREDRPEHPINCVDWGQAAAYCTWNGQRLPTEAEWEYAARGNDGRLYPWGQAAPSATRLNACGSECTSKDTAKRRRIPWKAMYDGSDGWETTAPVGSYPEGRSPSGALDMAGNVWEWTADWYGAYSKLAETNPQGPSTGTSRVFRGGGAGTVHTTKVRAANRSWTPPETRDFDLGFRCARRK
jgi:formylglycine-generating enzyme required for sulfatase activity